MQVLYTNSPQSPCPPRQPYGLNVYQSTHQVSGRFTNTPPLRVCRNILKNSSRKQSGMLDESQMATRRIAELYGVPRTILHQRVLGKHQDSRAAHRDEQLFSTGEEHAIAEYAGIMADAGFPLSPNLLWQIAQGIINEREMSQHGQRGGIIGPRESSTKIWDKRNQRLQQQGAVPSSTIHTVGNYWVNRFLDRNPGFKKVYIRYQERARAAATNVPPEACQSCTTEEYSSVQYLEL